MKLSLFLLPIIVASALFAGCTSTASRSFETSHAATDPAPYPGPVLVRHNPESFVGDQPGEAVLAVTVDQEQVKKVQLLRATTPQQGRNALVSAKTFGPATGVAPGVYTYKIIYSGESVPSASNSPDTYWVWYSQRGDVLQR